jgi:hypothetical protein
MVFIYIFAFLKYIWIFLKNYYRGRGQMNLYFHRHTSSNWGPESHGSK